MSALSTLVEKGFITDAQYKEIGLALLEKKDILVEGPPCSGKTTLLQAIADSAPKTKMIAILGNMNQETEMVARDGMNMLVLRTSRLTEPLSDGMRSLYHGSLRMKPEVVFVDSYPPTHTLLFTKKDAASTDEPKRPITIVSTYPGDHSEQFAELDVVHIVLETPTGDFL